MSPHSKDREEGFKKEVTWKLSWGQVGLGSDRASCPSVYLPRCVWISESLLLGLASLYLVGKMHQVTFQRRLADQK